MHVAVAIVAYRNPEDVVRCLRALAGSAHTDFEVVICENGGPPAYEALKAVLRDPLPGGQPVHAVLASGNLGYAGGVNLCIRESAGADAWWVLNPDTEPSPNALARMAARLAAGDCDAVGNTLQFPSGKVQSHGGRWRAALARAVSIGYGAPLQPAPDPTGVEAAQNYLNGASMLVSRRFVETAGLMQEDYFLYCEEVEWCLRARAKGLRLGFAPDAVVLHEQGTSTGNAPSLKARSRVSVHLGERNRLLLTRDRYPALLAVAAAAALVLLVLRFGRGRAWRQLGWALQGWAAGMAGQRGAPPWA